MIKDSCEGSGLSTIGSSQDSHPLFFMYFFNKAMLSQVMKFSTWIWNAGGPSWLTLDSCL